MRSPAFWLASYPWFNGNQIQAIPGAVALQPAAAASRGARVSIANFAFAPGQITIAPWQSVSWNNDDGAPHGLVWTDAEIITGSDGQPELRVYGTVAAAAARAGVTRWHVSLSHDGGVATAVVIAEGGAD